MIFTYGTSPLAQANRKLSLPTKPDAIALSPDGRFSQRHQGRERARHPVVGGEDWRETFGMRGPQGTNSDLLAFSPDGKTSGERQSSRIQPRFGMCPAAVLDRLLTSHTMTVPHLAFSPDGRTLVTRDAE